MAPLLTSLARPAVAHRFDGADGFFVDGELFLFGGGFAVAVGAVDGAFVERA